MSNKSTKQFPSSQNFFWKGPGTFFLIILTFILTIYILPKPSHTKQWETGFEKLPTFTISDTTLQIHNFRDYRYAPKKFLSFGYKDITVDVNTIQKVWLVVEPFSHPGVAHTYFVFDRKEGEPIVVSVEARREKGETYSAVLGMLNKFELIYVWGSEKDETVGRVLIWDDELYMYPLKLSEASAKQLFLQLAKDSQQLETTPRFYNTLLSNCTNELAKTANRVKPGTIPFDIALFLPAYSPHLLHTLGFIDNTMPLETLQKKYAIKTLVKKLYKNDDFSKELRNKLNK